MQTPRNRILYALLVILTIALGLFSRSDYIPELIFPYIGDAIYCLMFFFIIGFLFPSWSSLKVTIAAVLVCFAIEFSQLLDADWINNLRANRIGRLVLGRGFLVSDLVCYMIGGFVGFGIEWLMRSRR